MIVGPKTDTTFDTDAQSTKATTVATASTVATTSTTTAASSTTTKRSVLSTSTSSAFQRGDFVIPRPCFPAFVARLCISDLNRPPVHNIESKAETTPDERKPTRGKRHDKCHSRSLAPQRPLLAALCFSSSLNPNPYPSLITVTFWLDIDFFVQETASLQQHTRTMFTQQVQLSAVDILGVSVSPGSVKVASLLASEEAANAFLALVPLGVLTVDGHPVLAAPPAITDSSSGGSAAASASLLGAVIAAAVGGFMLALVLFMVIRRRSSKKGPLSTPPAYDESTLSQSLKSMSPPPSYHDAAAYHSNGAFHIYQQAQGSAEYEELPDGEVLYEMPVDGPQQASLHYAEQPQRATMLAPQRGQGLLLDSAAKQSSNVYDVASDGGSRQANATYDVANAGEPAIYSTAISGQDSGRTSARPEYDMASALPGAVVDYDVASGQHHCPEYDVATSGRGHHGAVYDLAGASPHGASYDNVGTSGQTLYDVINVSQGHREMIDFGFKEEAAEEYAA